MTRTPVTVLTYGSFDMFDQGDVRLLQRLSQLGDTLIVGCATDAYTRARGIHCTMPFVRRREVLEACRFVSRVIPETSFDQKRSDIVNYDVSVFAMDDRWTGQFDDLGDLTRVIYLPYASDLTPEEPFQRQISAA
ncbi:adenylyltransferase/cytidyltransferase family protein [Pseudosulfitobacter koreensis]|uniref:Adenylyltransferase/cytidyltransferase family protein n=1 Tax=Pseudosulfitobacter koreensis TaxID=2968472 RepID=A0ABT1Z263_9RHOB|nr:adenylyltransferase/cytidyltransferase family protein [Pseudosulfitobacter koreense]MCR8827224.1 adenylyltransferase/cytidyltransferase family protein [Pseudosulfitobacter koreense]